MDNSTQGPPELSAMFVLRRTPPRPGEVGRARKGPTRKRKRRVRDTQRARVYAAERRAFVPPGTGHIRETPRDFEDVRHADEYIETIRTSKWLATHYPRAAMSPVRIISGRGCNATESRIMLARWGLVKWVVLHELAHTVTDRHHRYETLPGHGREFARIYLALVRRWMGVAEYEKLRAAFKMYKVKYSLKKQRAKTAHLPRGNAAALAEYREKRKAAKAQATRLVTVMDKAGVPWTLQAAVAAEMIDRAANG